MNGDSEQSGPDGDHGSSGARTILSLAEPRAVRVRAPWPPTGALVAGTALAIAVVVPTFIVVSITAMLSSSSVDLARLVHVLAFPISGAAAAYVVHLVLRHRIAAEGCATLGMVLAFHPWLAITLVVIYMDNDEVLYRGLSSLVFMPLSPISIVLVALLTFAGAFTARLIPPHYSSTQFRQRRADDRLPTDLR